MPEDDECCGGFTLDVTVGAVNVTLHGHALLTPEVLDTFLVRVTGRATGADVARTRALSDITAHSIVPVKTDLP